MKKITILLLILLSTSVYCQIPIGKDVTKGKTEFKTFLTKNGFTFFKESKEQTYRYNKETGKHDIPSTEFYKILFKEEIEVNIFINQYENIEYLYILPENDNNRKKLLEIFSFKNWELISESKDALGIDYYYKMDEFYALLTSNGHINFNDGKN